jgi:hypothetical protein
MYAAGSRDREGALGPRAIPPKDQSVRALPLDLAAAIRLAAAHVSAELLVETSAGPGRIFVSKGAIAWVVAERDTTRLAHVINRRLAVDRELLRSTFAYCRDHGANFAEALVTRAGLDRDAVRAALREHNAHQLAQLARAKLARIDLVPNNRAYASDFVFSYGELVDHRPLASDVARIDTVSTTPPASTKADKERVPNMANIKQSLDEVMKLDGAIATAIVDWESGLTLGTASAGGFDIDLAASGNTAVVKSKMMVMRQLGIPGVIEDILISLETQYHLIRPLAKASSLFMYVAIDRQKGNLGLARHRLKQIEEALTI